MDSQMINKPFTLLTLMSSLLYSTWIPAFPWGSCPLWRTGSLRSSASAVCSRQRWRGSGRVFPDGRASASESLWRGCLCPLVPRTLWCCHQETRRSPWGNTLKFNNCVLIVYSIKDCKNHLLDPWYFQTLLVQQTHRLKKSSGTPLQHKVIRTPLNQFPTV